MTTTNCLHGDCSGGEVTTEWLAWKNMQDRCYKKNNASYSRYGLRGISVCKRWRDSYINFLSDMGRKPTPKHSLDRIDNNGNYEPSNCRWATVTEQCRNKSTNKILSLNGITMTLQEWAEYLGMDKRTLLWRIRAKWSVSDALTKPIDTKKKGTK